MASRDVFSGQRQFVFAALAIFCPINPAVAPRF